MKIRTSLLLSISVFAAPALAVSPAFAQTPTAAPETVVVTGSRIQTQGFTSPTPTTVVGVQQVEDRAAVSITDVLFDIPSIVNTTSNGSSTAGQSAINVRGLSGGTSARTLVLVDGERPIPNNQYGSPDVSVIPTELVQRTDIVTGGGSAAYGSDAIAGVVNLVLRDKIDGFRGNAQFGTSQRGDNTTYQGSLGWGTAFLGDRGQFMIAGEYSNAYGRQTVTSRDWSNKHTAFTTQTINGITYTNVPTDNLQLKGLTYGGVIIGTSTSLTTVPGSGPLASTSPLYGIQFGPGGAPIAFSYGTNPAVVSNTFGVNASGAFPNTDAPTYYGQDQIRRNVYGRATFQVTDDIKAFIEGGYAFSDTRAQQNAAFFYPNGGSTGFVIPITNPYLQALTTPLPGSTLTLAQTMAKNNIQTINVGRLLPEYGPYNTIGQFNLASVTFGAEGTFWDTGRWHFTGTNGGSFSLIKFYGNPDEPNERAAADPIVVGGQIVCNPVTVKAYGADPGCVPLNIFGPGSITPAAAAYVYKYAVNDITNRMTAFSGNVQDNLVDLWAGPLIATAGIEWRELSLSTISSPEFNLDPFTFNYGQTAPGGHDVADPKNIPLHKEDVSEAFAEAVLPLLAPDWKLGDMVVDVAGRAARYNVNKTNTTSWKTGLTYSPSFVPGFLLRGSMSQDTRAPNLSELFTGNRVNSGTFSGAANTGTAATSDPLQPGKQYGYTALSPGNPSLKPEIGRTVTFGFTYSPEFIDGLGFSIDRYDIQIDGQIASPSAANIILGCYGQGQFAGTPQPQYCQYINRAAGSGVQNITTIITTPLNVAQAHQEGYDFELHYASDLDRFIDGAPGHINFRFLATDEQTNTSKAFANLPTIIQAVGLSGTPEWKVTLNSTYTLGAYSFNMENRYVDSLNYVLSNTSTTPNAIPYLNNNIGAIWTTNVQLSYRFEFDSFDGGPKHAQLYLNINNLFDNNPPTIYSSGANPTFTTQNSYDIIGRAFRVGIRFNN